MATATGYRPARPTGRAGFARLLRAEWTKLRSAPRWVAAMLAATGLTVLFSLVIAAGSQSDANRHPDFVVGPDGQPVVDDFYFVHRPLSGDGGLTARVLTQDGRDPDSSSRTGREWAKAGIMLKESTASGAPYAAVMVTPGHGVRLQSNFTTDLAGGTGTAPRWLRLTRSGSSITGYESADGTTWSRLGTVVLGGLPETVEVGLFVGSPNDVVIERQFGSTARGEISTLGTATFDHVSAEAARPGPAAPWSGQEVGERGAGEYTESAGIFTVSGSGDIAPSPRDDDTVAISLGGILAGLMVIVAVGVLFVTAEYKRGVIRTSFLVSPRRGRVLAAKAIVIGSAAFVVGLIACLTALPITQPILRANGFAPPAFPPVSLADPAVLRSVVGSAALLALAAVFSLGLGTILRRSAGAITLAIALFVLPLLLATALPPEAGQWFMRLTPAGGFAVQRAKEPTDSLVEPWAMISPGAGLGAVAAYTAVTLAVGWWLLRRRDA